MHLDLATATLTDVSTGYVPELRFSDGTVLQIESEGRIGRPGSDARGANSDDDNALTALTQLIGTAVRTAAFDKEDGTLLLDFADGTELRVDGDPDYESWTLRLADGTIFVSQPGGQVVHFPPAANE